MQERRREPDGELVGAPALVGGGDVALAGGVYRDHPAHDARVDVLLAVGRVHRVAGEHRRDVDAALAQLVLPHLAAGACVQGVDVAVGVAVYPQALAVHHADHADRLRVHVGDVAARGRVPADLAGHLVEAEVAVPGRAPEVAPARPDDAQQQLVLVDERRRGAPAVARGPAELLGEAPAPHDGPVAVERVQVAVDVHGVEVPGLGVAGHAAPAHPVERHRGVQHVVAVLPELLAGLGVPAGHDLLLVDAVPRAPVGADPPVEDGGGRAPDPPVVPDEVLAVGRPARDEPGRVRDAGLGASAPARPVVRGGRAGRQARQQSGDERRGHPPRSAVCSRVHPAYPR